LSDETTKEKHTYILLHIGKLAVGSFLGIYIANKTVCGVFTGKEIPSTINICINICD
jgi:hypothetical protein